MIRFNRIRNQRGVVSLVFLLSMAGMMTALVGGVDMMRYTAVKTRAQDALDIAALAAGADLTSNATPAQIQAYAQGYFAANMPNGYLGSTFNASSLTAVVAAVPASGSTPAGTTVTLSISGSIPLLISGEIGSAPIPITDSSQSLRINQNNLEIALVLDNSGSMTEGFDGSGLFDYPPGSTSKMATLQTDANQLITTLLAANTDPNNPTTYIGLVPFTSTVNVRTASGALPTNMLENNGSYAPFTSLNASESASNNGWVGCLAEPANWLSQMVSGSGTWTSDLAPGANFHAYYDWYASQDSGTYTVGEWAGVNPGTYNDHTQYIQGSALSDSIINKYGANSAWESTYTQGTSKGKGYNPGTSNLGQYNCSGTPTTFLTTNATTLQNSINAMEPGGATFIGEGILWGWRMLDSLWQSAAAGWASADQSLAKLSANSSTNKVIIVITDGANDGEGNQFNMFSDPDYFNNGSMTSSGSGSSIKYTSSGSSPVLQNYFTSGFASSLGTFGSVAANDNESSSLDAVQTSICKGAYTQAGIVIFAIVIGNDDGTTSSEQALQTCTSSTGGQAFTATTASQLTSALTTIQGRLNTLRLSQ